MVLGGTALPRTVTSAMRKTFTAFGNQQPWLLDWNGDGRSDLLTSVASLSSTGTAAKVYSMQPDQTATVLTAELIQFSAEAANPFTWTSLGDIRGDGRDDVAIVYHAPASRGSGEDVANYHFGGGTGTVQATAGLSHFANRAVGMGDLDGNGYDDVALVNPIASGTTYNRSLEDTVRLRYTGEVDLLREQTIMRGGLSRQTRALS